jgi:hypothetical protein
VNFDHLKKRLKENIDDVSQKTRELLSKLIKLGDVIDAAAAIIPNIDGERSLKQITEQLKMITKRFNKQLELVEKIEAELNVVEAQRKEVIVQSLAVMNEVIDLFYHSTSSGNVSAMLELTSPECPHKGSITFTTQANGSPSQKVTKSSDDYTAALAFVFGILNVNRQQFVILNNVTRNISGEVEKFFKAQHDLQVINFTTLFSDETSNYAVRGKSQGFSIARIGE